LLLNLFFELLFALMQTFGRASLRASIFPMCGDLWRLQFDALHLSLASNAKAEGDAARMDRK